MKPNLLIPGAAKSGTTSLYYYLKQHPQVYMSEPKEPRFFEMEYGEGIEFYWNTYFSGWAGQPVIGEASPRNLYLPYIPQRIKAQLPEAKFIVILRNPIDRAFSHWWMTYSLGVEKLPFEEAIRANLEQLESGFTFGGQDGEKRWQEAIYWGQTRRMARYRWYLDMGYYAQQLERYLALFPRSQIKILFFEDLCQSPQAVMAEVWDFIEVDPDFELVDVAPQMVATPRAGLPLLKLAQATRTQYLIPQQVRSWLARLFARYGSKPPLDPAVRAWLVEHYDKHNRELERITGRDLSHWHK
jgi:hypothetical protein